jgi:hypothetical protein
MRRTWSALAGYDPALVQALSPRQREDLGVLGGAWCWSALGLSAPILHVGWLLTHSLPLSAAIGAGVVSLVLLLVRLTVAGGGRPLDDPRRAYRPSWTPLLWVALLGSLFALPAQLPLWRGDHAQRVEAERAALLTAHQRATAGVRDAASDDRYARELAECEFVVLRLQALWGERSLAIRYALGYLALLVGPVLLARLQAGAALRAYDSLKAGQARRLIAHDTALSERSLARLLAIYPSYRPRDQRLDPPDPRARRERA